MRRLVLFVLVGFGIVGCATTEPVKPDDTSQRLDAIFAVQQRLSLRMDEMALALMELKDRLAVAETGVEQSAAHRVQTPIAPQSPPVAPEAKPVVVAKPTPEKKAVIQSPTGTKYMKMIRPRSTRKMTINPVAVTRDSMSYTSKYY